MKALVFAIFAGSCLGADTSKISAAWDALLPDTVQEASAPQSQTTRTGDFLSHVFLEGRTEYWRYSTNFTGLPTATGIINGPVTGVFNPAGMPYPAAFQPDANRVYSVIDFGTRGWLSDRVNTHFALRYAQDVTPVTPGAQAANILETYPGNRAFQLVTAAVDINAAPGTSIQLGRQYVYGAEMASLDGASVTFDRPQYAVTVFGGRRFTYDSDPLQRGIGGVNFAWKLGPDASLEYTGLWYVRASQSLGFRKRLGLHWLVASFLRAYGGTPVEFSGQGLYANRQTSLRLNFVQRLSSRDYYYDYTYPASDRDPYNTLLRLYLGPLEPYSQFAIDAQHGVGRRLELGGSVWVRQLLNSNRQGPSDTSFRDYRGHVQFTPLRATQTFFEYHQRNSDRLSPFNAASFSDISGAGETSVKDLTGELRRSFAEGRLSFHGGLYYRRISLQDAFSVVNGAHQSGWLAGASWRIDEHERLYADYDLDNDFFLFRPQVANSRLLRLGIAWKH